jgi:hypothetical protein
MELIEATIEGIAPTILHNGRMANPMDEYAKQLKAISGKRKKTDDDYAEMARIEWHGSLYLDSNLHPCWPSEAVEGLLIAAAKKSKEGPQAKTGLLIIGDFPIKYAGPKDIEELWADKNYRIAVGVNVGGSKVIRTRPIFRSWSLDLQVQFDPEIVNRATVMHWITVGGKLIGLSDWRPKFGRYELKA